MEYYFNTIVNSNFDTTKTKTENALKEEGFGIVSQIDMQSKIKEKLGVDYKRYLILGACNPAYSYKALLTEEKIGVMLPCNILIIDKENGTTEVAAVNPIASMIAIENAELGLLASEITEKIKRVIKKLE
jgi:uncharacterized protein (DUF302 family)